MAKSTQSRRRGSTKTIAGAPLGPVQAERAIHRVRGMAVLLDEDLAAMYGVATKNLNKAVARNISRFPQDFMFQLTAEEAGNLRFQTGTSSFEGYGGRRYLPYAFTEQGVAMLSSVLRSPRAVAVNIEIMRAFVRMRRVLATNKSLAKKIAVLDRRFKHKSAEHEAHLKRIYQILDSLIDPPEEPRKKSKIGFRPPEES